MLLIEVLIKPYLCLKCVFQYFNPSQAEVLPETPHGHRVICFVCWGSVGHYSQRKEHKLTVKSESVDYSTFNESFSRLGYNFITEIRDFYSLNPAGDLCGLTRKKKMSLLCFYSHKTGSCLLLSMDCFWLKKKTYSKQITAFPASCGKIREAPPSSSEEQWPGCVFL